ncbi:MAG: hypothetical protein GKS06_09955 [Acidobacteria bacterium]|nr:hypothetical protein [Acidobacteriota bacterium]
MSTKSRPDGITILSLWYFVLAGGALFGACVATVPIGLITMSDMPTGGRLITSLLLGAGVTITLVVGVVCALVGWGLWNVAAWARPLALVLAVLHLPFFPVGTAIGIGTLWYIGTHDDARTAFGSS